MLFQYEWFTSLVADYFFKRVKSILTPFLVFFLLHCCDALLYNLSFHCFFKTIYPLLLLLLFFNIKFSHESCLVVWQEYGFIGCIYAFSLFPFIISHSGAIRKLVLCWKLHIWITFCYFYGAHLKYEWQFATETVHNKIACS